MPSSGQKRNEVVSSTKEYEEPFDMGAIASIISDDIKGELLQLSAYVAQASSDLTSQNQALPHLQKVKYIAEGLSNLVDSLYSSSSNEDTKRRKQPIKDTEQFQEQIRIMVNKFNRSLTELLTQTLVAHVKLPAQHPNQTQIARMSLAADNIASMIDQLVTMVEKVRPTSGSQTRSYGELESSEANS